MVKKENKFSWTMVGFIAYLALPIENFFNPVSSRGMTTTTTVVLSFFALTWLWQIVAEIRKKLGLDRQREAAALGEVQKLAQEQPSTEADTFSLPLRIQHIPRNGMWIVLLYIYTVVFLILEIVFISLTLQSRDANKDLDVQIAIIFPVTLVVLWVGTWLYRSQQWLEVTDDGLSFRTLISKRTIRWRDALLFAVHLPISASRPIFATDDIYEVSSARSIIHWTWKKGWFPSQVVRTRVHPETQQQQMQGLLSIIRAKTGLSLYDFR